MFNREIKKKYLKVHCLLYFFFANGSRNVKGFVSALCQRGRYLPDSDTTHLVVTGWN